MIRLMVRQTNEWTDGSPEADRQTDGQLGKKADGWMDKKLNWPLDGQPDRRADIRTDRPKTETGPTD